MARHSQSSEQGSTQDAANSAAQQNASGLRALAGAGEDGEKLDLWAALGGVRGLVEAVAPFLVFIVTYMVSKQLLLALGLVGVLLAVIIVARLIQRQTLMGAFSGMLVTLVSVAFAALQNSARDFYSPGIFINAGMAVLLLLSVLVRKPGIGWILDQFFPEPLMDRLRSAYTKATWVFIGGFTLRLAVEIPLYMTHNVDALGIARIITGVPLFAVLLAASWMIIAPARKKLAETDKD
ncbi:hypothetical protein B9G54_05200 [Alloscardovia macacae]|uniref:Zinc ABC transporter permease n=1 Tax=Alloscardovia macacae TaxID=1160091 RepID=A0A1Y2STQ7_9BIFI|nr:DUF3159 domain-containing protein [Alloscardovia macacae]OTA26378.1 hypothetical protein B9G54_05200 [Alloscardovia macacae]OTA28816.1 hypothetical protein B9T39_05680 [Alloscardovia macacae]